MNTLVDAINDAALYRTAWTMKEIDKPTAIVCSGKVVGAALEWFRTHYRRMPEYVVAPGSARVKSAGKLVSISFLRNHPELQVVVFGPGERQLAIQLALGGIRSFLFASDPQYKNVKFDVEYLRRNREDLERLFLLLEDEESRRTLASVVKQRVTGEHGFLRIAGYKEYEHPRIQASLGDWVADCGASNGATSFRFAQKVGTAGQVFAFEPDPFNIDKINAALLKHKEDINNVTVVNAAVSDKSGTMRFSEAKGGASRISEDGGIEVSVCTLDEFSQAKKLTGPGLISLDVEGYEKQALAGGLKTIKELRPKLQVSVYHKPKDLFSLALWLNEELEDYRFFMGHHDSYHTETDVYAIPSEKMSAPADG